MESISSYKGSSGEEEAVHWNSMVVRVAVEGVWFAGLRGLAALMCVHVNRAQQGPRSLMSVLMPSTSVMGLVSCCPP